MSRFRDTCPTPPTDQRPHYFIGVDLGKARNHSALAVLERRWLPGTPDQFRWSAARQYYGEWSFDVVRAARLPLGARYGEAVDWLEQEVLRYYWPCRKTILVDATGVGSAVIEQMRRVRALAKGETRLLAVKITSGDAHAGYRLVGNQTEKEISVPRLEVVAGLRSAVEARAFSVHAERCGEQMDVDLLRHELASIQAQGKGHDTQDDLAFALALAVWWAKPHIVLASQQSWDSINPLAA